jgi:hypothetical protein
VPPAPHGVGLARCTFVDTTRTTYDYATGQTLPNRVLPTEIRYPTAAQVASGARLGAIPLARPGGWPTIFFAPGYDVTPDDYAALLDAWVRDGFVVVAPTFPDTNPTAVAAANPAYGQPEDDLTNQPGDVIFVVHAALSASMKAASCRVLHGLLDPGELALAGQSDGGDTVALVAYGQSGPGAGLGNTLPIADIKATAILSGAEWPGDSYGAGPGAPALLVVQSTTDECNPPQESVALYDAINETNKWFLTLHDADHLGPYDGDDATGFGNVVAVTTRFFHQELTGKTASVETLGSGLVNATLTTGPSAPPLPVLPFSKPACAAPGSLRTS